MTPSEPSPPDNLVGGRYAPIKLLGGSVFGRTILAEDVSTRQQIVLKQLDVGQAEDWKEIELFERGARTLKSLEHPQIPAFLDAFYDEENAQFCLVQDYVEGVDLKQKLATDGPLDSDEISNFLASMLDILEYLHSLSPPVIHRDIKPSNILLHPDGTYMLIDFDVVQTVIPDRVGGSTVVGTTGYMPPEQLVGRAGPASDIFALGATAVHLATGVEPINLAFEAHGFDFEAHSPLSEGLNRVLKRMLNPRLEIRFRRVAEVRQALGEVSRSRELSIQARLALQKHIAGQPYTDFFRAVLNEHGLRVEILSRPRLGLKIAGYTSALMILATLIIISIEAAPAVLWAASAASLVVCTYMSVRFLRRFNYETGIKQTLEITPDTVTLREEKVFRLFGGRSRPVQSWSIPRRALGGVYLSLLDDAELPEGKRLWRQALENQKLNQAGLIFVDQDGTSHPVGNDLLRDAASPKYRHRLGTIREFSTIVQSYLRADSSQDTPEEDPPRLESDSTSSHSPKKHHKSNLPRGVTHES